MTTLLAGFDSAWTPSHSGAIVGLLHSDDGTFRDIDAPRIVNYREAECLIRDWQSEHDPEATIVLLDQPTIVQKATGQRDVENIVASPVSRRYGGVQPANTGRQDLFGGDAPVWGFLSEFGGPADPLRPGGATRVFETYPVLAMIALGWTLPDSRATGRLPKYNPGRKKTFLIRDWQFLCRLASEALRPRGLVKMVNWIDNAALKASPQKCDQDCLDACLCLLVAICLAERKDCLMVGNLETGYIVAPYGAGLRSELNTRCEKTGRAQAEWVRVFRLT